MTEFCLVRHEHSFEDINPIHYTNSSTEGGDNSCMTGEMLKLRSDDLSVVTAPTVCASTYGDCGDASETDDSYYEYSGYNDDDDQSVTSRGLHCVSFNEMTHIREIPARWEYTADETEALWYSRREKEVMREAAYGIAESLDYHYFIDEYGRPASTNFRGLETYTREGAKERRLMRVKNLVAVLREQRRQRACGEVVTNGPELLEAACYPTSSKCQKLAYEQAIRDEKDARGEKKTNQQGGIDESPSMMLHLTRLLRDLGGSSEWGSSD